MQSELSLPCDSCSSSRERPRHWPLPWDQISWGSGRSPLRARGLRPLRPSVPQLQTRLELRAERPQVPCRVPSLRASAAVPDGTHSAVLRGGSPPGGARLSAGWATASPLRAGGRGGRRAERRPYKQPQRLGAPSAPAAAASRAAGWRRRGGIWKPGRAQLRAPALLRREPGGGIRKEAFKSAQASGSGNKGAKGGRNYTGAPSDAATPRAGRLTASAVCRRRWGGWGGSVQPPAAWGAAVNADPAPRPKRDLGARGPAEARAGRPVQGSILPLFCSGGAWVLGSATPRTNSSFAPSRLRRLHHLPPFPGPWVSPPG